MRKPSNSIELHVEFYLLIGHENSHKYVFDTLFPIIDSLTAFSALPEIFLEIRCYAFDYNCRLFCQCFHYGPI